MADERIPYLSSKTVEKHILGLYSRWYCYPSDAGFYATPTVMHLSLCLLCTRLMGRLLRVERAKINGAGW